MSAYRNRPKFWQRKYLINLRFQLKYIVYVLLASTLISGVLSYFVYKETLLNSEILEMQELLGNQVHKEDTKVLYSLLAFILFQGISILIFALMLTHRIAGPLYRVELFLKAIALGECMHVRSFRKGDEFKSLADLMNNVSDFLIKIAKDETIQLDEVREFIADKDELNSESLKSLRAKLDELVKAKASVFRLN